jgi:muconolactone delta-isomerase
MYFFATGAVSQPDQLGPHRAEEDRVLAELRNEGVVREAFRRTAGPGVISILEAPSLEEAQAQMGRLPFVALGFMSFEYTEVTPL